MYKFNQIIKFFKKKFKKKMSSNTVVSRLPQVEKDVSPLPSVKKARNQGYLAGLIQNISN